MTHQNQTTTRLADGSSLNADNTPFFVLPPQLAQQYGVHPGDLALVKNGDKVSPAIFGDVGPCTKLGEGSTRLAANLGINTDPNSGGTPSGVSYQVFPGSGKGVPLTNANTTTEALWQRINQLQGRTDQTPPSSSSGVASPASPSGSTVASPASPSGSTATAGPNGATASTPGASAAAPTSASASASSPAPAASTPAAAPAPAASAPAAAAPAPAAAAPAPAAPAPAPSGGDGS